MREPRRAFSLTFVMHSMRLDTEMDECVSADEVMRRVSDLTLLSASEVDLSVRFSGCSSTYCDMRSPLMRLTGHFPRIVAQFGKKLPIRNISCHASEKVLKVPDRLP